MLANGEWVTLLLEDGGELVQRVEWIAVGDADTSKLDGIELGTRGELAALLALLRQLAPSHWWPLRLAVDAPTRGVVVVRLDIAHDDVDSRALQPLLGITTTVTGLPNEPASHIEPDRGPDEPEAPSFEVGPLPDHLVGDERVEGGKRQGESNQAERRTSIGFATTSTSISHSLTSCSTTEKGCPRCRLRGLR